MIKRILAGIKADSWQILAGNTGRQAGFGADSGMISARIRPESG